MVRVFLQLDTNGHVMREVCMMLLAIDGLLMQDAPVIEELCMMLFAVHGLVM